MTVHTGTIQPARQRGRVHAGVLDTAGPDRLADEQRYQIYGLSLMSTGGPPDRDDWMRAGETYWIGTDLRQTTWWVTGGSLSPHHEHKLVDRHQRAPRALPTISGPDVTLEPTVYELAWNAEHEHWDIITVR
jgi:hypothetical protein